jgi:hypothetical protein
MHIKCYYKTESYFDPGYAISLLSVTGLARFSCASVGLHLDRAVEGRVTAVPVPVPVPASSPEHQQTYMALALTDSVALTAERQALEAGQSLVPSGGACSLLLMQAARLLRRYSVPALLQRQRLTVKFLLKQVTPF